LSRRTRSARRLLEAARRRCCNSGVRSDGGAAGDNWPLSSRPRLAARAAVCAAVASGEEGRSERLAADIFLVLVSVGKCCAAAGAWVVEYECVVRCHSPFAKRFVVYKLLHQWRTCDKERGGSAAQAAKKRLRRLGDASET
jgi:hypothetical protein